MKNPSTTQPATEITNKKSEASSPSETAQTPEEQASKPNPKKEYKGYADQGLLEPTRYGDWDVKGRCSDF